jgi:hypothetical protein
MHNSFHLILIKPDYYSKNRIDFDNRLVDDRKQAACWIPSGLPSFSGSTQQMHDMRQGEEDE